MESIPPLFWMFIITLLSVGLFMILFYVAMAVRESINTIKETTSVLSEVKGITHESKIILIDMQSIVATVKTSVVKLEGTVEEINDNVVRPVRAIGQVLGFISSKIPSSLKGKR